MKINGQHLSQARSLPFMPGGPPVAGCPSPDQGDPPSNDEREAVVNTRLDQAIVHFHAGTSKHRPALVLSADIRGLLGLESGRQSTDADGGVRRPVRWRITGAGRRQGAGIGAPPMAAAGRPRAVRCADMSGVSAHASSLAAGGRLHSGASERWVGR